MESHHLEYKSSPDGGKLQNGTHVNENLPIHSTYPVAIPYYAPETEIPTVLPTVAEIESSQEVFYERTAVKVAAVGLHFVVKYGLNVSLEEGRTMKFAGDCARIPVPRLYALYQHERKNYIVMERINGDTLEERWDELNELQKMEYAAEIKRHLQSLRDVPSPKGYCSLDNKPLRDSLFWTECEEGPMRCNGPFDSELDLVNGIVKKCQASEAMKGKASFYRKVLPSVFYNHPPTLTHGDIQLKNIIVRAKPAPDHTLVFVDWEVAGWYPSFWEFAQTMDGCRLFQGDWHHWILQFLDPFLNEYAWLHTLTRELDW